MNRIPPLLLLCAALTQGFSPQVVAQAAEDGEPPADTVKFRFDWPQGLSARVEMVNTMTQSSPTGTAEASAALRYQLKVAPQGEKLKITVDGFEFLKDVDPAKPGLGDLTMIGAVVPAYLVTPKGEYSGIEDPKGTREYLRNGVVSALPAGLNKQAREAAERALDVFISEAMLDQFVGDQWNIMVGFWIDSEPELGETYENSTEEVASAVPGSTVRMNLEFRVLRRLPCTRSGQERQCVETTLITTVDPEDGRKLTSQVLGQIAGPRGTDLLKDANLLLVRRTNLITEPEGLIPHSYVHEEMVTLKLGPDKPGTVRSKKRTVTFSYD